MWIAVMCREVCSAPFLAIWYVRAISTHSSAQRTAVEQKQSSAELCIALLNSTHEYAGLSDAMLCVYMKTTSTHPLSPRQFQKWGRNTRRVWEISVTTSPLHTAASVVSTTHVGRRGGYELHAMRMHIVHVYTIEVAGSRARPAIACRDMYMSARMGNK